METLLKKILSPMEPFPTLKSIDTEIMMLPTKVLSGNGVSCQKKSQKKKIHQNQKKSQQDGHVGGIGLGDRLKMTLKIRVSIWMIFSTTLFRGRNILGNLLGALFRMWIVEMEFR
jgi:hypothetical protein